MSRRPAEDATGGDAPGGACALARALCVAQTPEAVDAAYANLAPQAHRRRFAQVQTPADCAALMADWVTAGPRPAGPRRVLDPALGTGILARAVLARDPGAAVVAHEPDALSAGAARRALDLAGMAGRVALHQTDFLTSDPGARFDGIIGNPPWLARRDLPDARARIAATAARAGVALAGTSNAYVLFLIESCLRLAPGGRLAFLIPMEWANANFGAPVKRFLLDRGLLCALVPLSPARAVFAGVLSTACLLLIARADAPPDAVRICPVGATGPLPDLAGVMAGQGGRWLPVADLRAAAKWEPLIAGPASPMPHGFVRLGDMAGSRRGIATGANAFFHLPLARARAIGLAPGCLRPCVGRAGDAPGLVFAPADLAALEASGRAACLVTMGDPLDAAARAHVAAGEAAGVHLRHLTRARTPWYAPERQVVAPIWVTVFGRDRMRFVLNTAGALTLTPFHGILPHRQDAVFLRALAACLNSPMVQALIAAQARVFGGGLRKLEPRDLLEIPVPDLRRMADDTLAGVAAAFDRVAAGEAGPDLLDDAIRRALRQPASDVTEMPANGDLP